MKRILFVVLILALSTGSALATDFNGDGTEDIAVFRGSTGETEMVAEPGDKWSTSFSAQSVTRVYMNVTVPNGPGTYAQLIVNGVVLLDLETDADAGFDGYLRRDFDGNYYFDGRTWRE